ncbi:hypothetical protein CYY_009230 [Polysphondylium violaceum]|uniref:arginine--tRNA ligase n=1 Tax=Polysphondylium violaceum TaxID=133409 RepID=A0A8J4UWC3_9MYCE|nr:hypothetical protein CYY_009230 [Polysphondylium violaceum]
MIQSKFNSLNKLYQSSRIICLKRNYSSNNTSLEDYNLNNKWFNLDKKSTYAMLHSTFNHLIDQTFDEQEKRSLYQHSKQPPFKPIFSVPPTKFKCDFSLNNIPLASKMINIKGNDTVYYSKKLTDSFSNIKHQLPDKYSSKLIDKMEVVDKGFINITLSNDYLVDSLRMWCIGKEDLNSVYQLSDSNRSSTSNAFSIGSTSKKRVLVDFASPNMSKELHAGHLRSIALGESVCRILEYMGHDVERISHAGDFGTPMGMVIAHALEIKSPFLRHIWDKDNKEIQQDITAITPKELSTLYSESKKKTKMDPEFNKKTLLTAAELQKGPPQQDGSGSNPDIYNAWLRICEASRIGFQNVFDLLKVTAKERGESFYREFLPLIVNELKEKGLAKESQGAMCVFLNGDQEDPYIIQKSDGAYLYSTTDLAAIKNRIESGKEWIIIITDESQKSHFEKVFSIATQVGWLDKSKTRVDHLAFGVVRGADGQKLSSRDGSPIPLIDLLNEAISRAIKASDIAKSFTRSEKMDLIDSTSRDLETKERLETKYEMDADDDDHNSSSSNIEHFKKIGMGALKYFDLSQRNASYTFNYNNMLAFKGNTSIYLLYSYSRISTLLKRANFNVNLLNLNEFVFKEFTEKERHLVFLISRFSDIIKSTENTLRPGVLCDYLWDVANSFHAFYESERIIGSDRQDQRLLICFATQRILSTGLNLLGVETVERI